MIRLTKDETETIEKLFLLSGIQRQDIRNVLESLATLLIFSYQHNEEFIFPFLGKTNMSVSDNAKITIDLSSSLLDIIKQVDNNEETDFEKILKKKIVSNLSEYVNI